MKSLVPIVLAGLVSAVAFASTKVASDMPRSTRTGLVDVIVQFKGGSSNNQVEQVRAFGYVRRQFRTISALNMTVPLSMVDRLAANPQIAYVSPNRTTTSFLDITTQSV